MMLDRILALSRSFGVALAIFIVFNLVLALEGHGLSLTRIWLDIHFSEPFLSIFATPLAIALLTPHDVVRTSRWRWIFGGIVLGFWMLCGSTVGGYYYDLHHAKFRSVVPAPFSLVVWVVLLLELVRIVRARSCVSKMPPPAWCFVRGVSLAVAFLGLVLFHIVSFGATDFRRDADAAIVLGAKVYDDGTVSSALRDRLETGLELYRLGLVRNLIMSGGIGKNGLSEPAVMAEYARRRGVPADRIFLDEDGTNTQASAVHCGVIARQEGFERLLTVSQGFHCARVKMIFERYGTLCETVPTRSSEIGLAHLSRQSFSLFREAVAFPFYFLYYRG